MDKNDQNNIAANLMQMFPEKVTGYCPDLALQDEFVLRVRKRLTNKEKRKAEHLVKAYHSCYTLRVMK